jgi:general secretion pathway protein I
MEASMSRSEKHGVVPFRRSAEHGFTPLRRSAEHGFTLVEMMVALAVFSLAALALMRLLGASAATTVSLRDQAVAQIVARNIAVETLSDPAPPAFGNTRGEVANAGGVWLWTRQVGRSPDARIQQIEIGVANRAGRGAAALTVFRRVQ